MSEGERALPTAQELADLYGSHYLCELIDLAGDVDDHAALEVLRAARRIQKRARLVAALNVEVVREERARMYGLKIEQHNAQVAMQQAEAARPMAFLFADAAVAGQPCASAAQSVSPSE